MLLLRAILDVHCTCNWLLKAGTCTMYNACCYEYHYRTSLKLIMSSRDSSISLNMPSSLLVKLGPHSVVRSVKGALATTPSLARGTNLV